MKMRITIVAEYDIPDDLAKRERMYSTTDPHECAKVDQENQPFELLEMAERVVSYEVRPVPDAVEA